MEAVDGYLFGFRSEVLCDSVLGPFSIHRILKELVIHNRFQQDLVNHNSRHGSY